MEEGSIKLQYLDDYGNPTWEIEFDAWQVLLDEKAFQVRINLCGDNVKELTRCSPRLNVPMPPHERS